ncbi:MAG: ATP-dependent zinc metalloprotease FtsH [Christensenellaceae bacterium]|nr:ATP-dependent zinc metalloprotease FtsH [Christensenellaceae bacterium]
MLYLLIIAAIFLLTQSSSLFSPEKSKDVVYSEFLQLVRDGEITNISVTQNDLVALKNGSSIAEKDFPAKYDYSTYIPSVDQFSADMQEIFGGDKNYGGIKVKFNPLPETSLWLEFLPMIILLIGLGVFTYFTMANQGGGKAMNFSKSRAKVTMGQDTGKTFKDVAGADEEKEELAEIVEFLKNPKKFTGLGARVPKGVLLVGPPGGGKTLLAKAVAGEARVPFFSISGSDFVEMFVGVGAARVRDLFESAKKNSPSIIFIDEIDAVGRRRGAGLGGGHDEREQTLNQLLVEMDGFQVNDNIIVIAATNRKDILDPALLRAGRFDRQVYVNYPDVKGREEILRVHSKGKPLAKEVDLMTIARRTIGFIGADLENVMNEAAILTARREKKEIGMQEIEEAIMKIVAGPEKRSRVVTEKDKRCTSVHEVGHALVAANLKNCDPVYEVSIIPRGMAAGYTMMLPETDDRHEFRSAMLDSVAMSLGGRVAESLILGDISTGASQDIKQATSTVKDMVTKYGMSELIGPVYIGGQEEVFLGKDYGHTKDYSESFAQQVDGEIRRIIKEGYAEAERILSENTILLCEIADILIANEKIDGDEFRKLISDPMARREALVKAHGMISREAMSAEFIGEETKEDFFENAGEAVFEKEDNE